MSDLQTMLSELIEGASNTLMLAGGALLDWNADTKTLTATRLNRPLESKPSEQKTFEEYIRRAGYRHTEALPVAERANRLGNERIGVKWTVTKAKASKAAAKREAQGSLF